MSSGALGTLKRALGPPGWALNAGGCELMWLLGTKPKPSSRAANLTAQPSLHPKSGLLPTALPPCEKVYKSINFSKTGLFFFFLKLGLEFYLSVKELARHIESYPLGHTRK